MRAFVGSPKLPSQPPSQPGYDATMPRSFWFVLLALGCGSQSRGESQAAPGATGASASEADTGLGATSVARETTTTGSGTTGLDPKLDLAPPTLGCEAVDLLFVIDNSESMQTYQRALADAFPGFVDAMFSALPTGTSLHVGLTTTEFDAGCDEPEATENCQSTASVAAIGEHYVKPTQAHDGGNGSQGRLFAWAGQRYFATSTADDPVPLVEWFSQAAVAAGEDGCSFEMPVAAAAWATSPVNASTNAGFLRDEGGLLVVFFLTDEPDKSPESKMIYRDMLVEAKAACGGETCVFASGIIPSCTRDINQKLWQFLELWSAEPPPWGDITDTGNYGAYFGQALADAVAQACARIPVP